MIGRISSEDRDCFKRLVDVLLPQSGAFPAGNDVGVGDAELERIIDLHSDLVPELIESLRKVRGLTAQEAVDLLEAEDGIEWWALRTVAFGAYYTSKPVQGVLSYAGQPSNPVDDDQNVPTVDTELLAPVLARGPFWRHAP